MSEVAARSEFYDINAFLGRPVRVMYRSPATASEMLEEMDSFGISRAVVWHIGQHDYDPVEGNRLLCEAIAGRERLYGCWTILPPQTGEVDAETFFAEMRRNRIVGLRAFPTRGNYLLEKVVFGGLFEQLIERRVPLLLSLSRGISWNDVYAIMREFPKLTCVLCDIGTWGRMRFTWPLLDAYPNIYLETSCVSLEDGGVEATVARFGAERLLFGTGFPERYASAAVLQLLHAEIPDADKEKIASGNLRDLMAGMRL